MGTKSLRIALKNDRVEMAERTMLAIGKAVNDNIVHLGRDITMANSSLKAIREEMAARTLGGRWKRLKKWIGGKK